MAVDLIESDKAYTQPRYTRCEGDHRQAIALTLA
jgi:hypothetical protein